MLYGVSIRQGRDLSSYETSENKFEYLYDENGMRYRTTITNKEDNSVGYLDYVWVDSKLISISFTSDELNQTVTYLYNDFGEPVGFIATREDGSVDTFYYLKNAQGDITHIVSAAGKKMISFTYDAFGKRTVTYQANNSTTPGQIELLTQMKADLLNPFAYRGYCYDYDMGMYYLQSRYYDPSTGRFINADSTDYLDYTGTVLGCNLFAYCENDPVNSIDTQGRSSQRIAEQLVEAIIMSCVVDGFLSKLISNRTYEIKGKAHKNGSGLYEMTIRYKPKKNKLNTNQFKLIIGGYEAWNSKTTTYNADSSIYFDYYGQCIMDEANNIATPSIPFAPGPEPNVWGNQIMVGVMIGTYAVFGVKATEAKKIVNQIWGKNGLDPHNKNLYFACKIKNDSKYNGVYAYSLVKNTYKKLSV